MAKVKLLLDVIEDIRSLADSLEAVADAMESPDSPISEPEQPESTASPVKKEGAPTAKTMSKEELRTLLGEKSLAGHKETIQALIRKYGGKKFSDIDPSHYPALQKDAEGLPDAT